MVHGRIVSDPEEIHICGGNSECAIVMDQLLKVKRQEITRLGKSPRTAYHEVLANVAQRFDREQAAQVERHLGAFTRRKSGFYKAYSRKSPHIGTLEANSNSGSLAGKTYASFRYSSASGCKRMFLL